MGNNYLIELRDKLRCVYDLELSEEMHQKVDDYLIRQYSNKLSEKARKGLGLKVE
ncbi:MAG: hypothetical protein ACP5OG_02490 [Candidatus Nanoarchaeia archaeon]